MDYYMVLCTVPSFKFQKDSGGSKVGAELVEVREVIDSLGLGKFASALMWVLGKVFGLEEKYMPWTPNEEDGKFLLNEVMLAGNFGHHRLFPVTCVI